MNVYDYCDAINANIEIRRYSNQSNRWSASFDDCDTKENATDPCVTGMYGTGDSPVSALRDFIQKISGKVLVFSAYSSERRRVFVCPTNIEV